MNAIVADGGWPKEPAENIVSIARAGLSALSFKDIHTVAQPMLPLL